MRRSRRHSLIGAVLASLLLHLAAVLVMGRLRAPPPPRRDIPQSDRHDALALELEVVELPPPAPARPVEAPRAPARPPTRPRSAKPPGVAVAPQAAAEPTAPATAPAPLARELRSSLFPELPGLLPDVKRSRGTVFFPEAEESPAHLAERRARAAETELNAYAQGTLAQARVGRGLVDPYFMQLRDALQALAKDAPRFSLDNPLAPDGLKAIPAPLKDLGRSWLNAAELYGQTGSPALPGAAPTAAQPDAPGAGSVLRVQPGSPQEALAQKLAAGNMLRAWGSGEQGVGIIAVVELRQAADGALLAAALVQSSGNPIFDRHVLSVAPAAVATLGPPPSEGSGIHDGGLRSVWSFEGRVSFLRKLRPGEATPADAVKGLALLGLSWASGGWVPMVGNFDEATGELSVMDPSEAHFTTKVKLLQVY